MALKNFFPHKCNMGHSVLWSPLNFYMYLAWTNWYSIFVLFVNTSWIFFMKTTCTDDVCTMIHKRCRKQYGLKMEFLISYCKSNLMKQTRVFDAAKRTKFQFSMKLKFGRSWLMSSFCRDVRMMLGGHFQRE